MRSSLSETAFPDSAFVGIGNTPLAEKVSSQAGRKVHPPGAADLLGNEVRSIFTRLVGTPHDPFRALAEAPEYMPASLPLEGTRFIANISFLSLYQS
jgi:hypothetical protein